MADKGPDRERTLNDITNTGVTAALIGGSRACVGGLVLSMLSDPTPPSRFQDSRWATCRA